MDKNKLLNELMEDLNSKTKEELIEELKKNNIEYETIKSTGKREYMEELLKNIPEGQKITFIE